MPTNRARLPSYRHHKPSGQAVVTLSGRDVYLGLHGTKLSRDAYDRVVAEWLAAGRTFHDPLRDATITVIELLNAFRKAGAIPPSHADAYKAVMTLLVRLYGRTPAASFGPLALKAVREQMIAAGWNRKTINDRFYVARRIFRWGVEHEMLPPSVSQALDAVAGLRAGQSEARESEAVQPVALEHVAACLPQMPPAVRKMVELQLLTGMRPGELVIMRTADIDTTGPVWIYRPTKHKSQNRGKKREIAIGPKGQALLRPLLQADLQAFVFSPIVSECLRRETAHAARTTPLNAGNRPGSIRTPDRTRPPGERYDVASYRRAITRAADAAFPPRDELRRRKGETEKTLKQRLGAEKWAELEAWRAAHRWHPHQLRHTFATDVRKQFGLEHAQRSLGHAHANITERYAAVALEKAIEVAAAIG